IDECRRLWIVDVGRTAGVRVCPMKIMIFDLFTDQLVHKYEIPHTQAFGMASLVTPIVEVGETCLQSVLYIADVAEYGLVVYDLEADRSWRLNNTQGNAFGPDPDAMNITIANESFDLTDGTLGMSLSPPAFFKESRSRRTALHLLRAKNSSDQFYRFLRAKHKLIQREKWIDAVKQQNADWQPKENDLICIAHFIGNKKGEEVLSPSYTPTEFSKTPVVNEKSIISRHNSILKHRLVDKQFIVAIKVKRSFLSRVPQCLSDQENMNVDDHRQTVNYVDKTQDQECQANTIVDCNEFDKKRFNNQSCGTLPKSFENVAVGTDSPTEIQSADQIIF
ncbi:hypothetical protein PV327_011048, partial [Microctonus hyperodae]